MPRARSRKGLSMVSFVLWPGGRCAQIKSVGFEPYLLSRYRQTPCNQISKAHVSPRERYRFTLGCYENWRFWIARRKANASLCSMYVRSSCKQTVSWGLNFAYPLRNEIDRERILGWGAYRVVASRSFVANMRLQGDIVMPYIDLDLKHTPPHSCCAGCGDRVELFIASSRYRVVDEREIGHSLQQACYAVVSRVKDNKKKYSWAFLPQNIGDNPGGYRRGG